MARTLINGANQLQSATIIRSLINTSNSGSALITKVIAGSGISLSSTGVDAGTGDVTITSSTSFSKASVSDSNYTITSTNQIVAMATLTANRVLSLPAASTYSSGNILYIKDESGNAASSKTITINVNGTDVINGSLTSLVINTAYGFYILNSNGSNSWYNISGTSSSVTGIFNESVKTANYTAVAFDEVWCNTTSSSFTITLPASPVVSNRVRVMRSGSNNVIVANNGNTINSVNDSITIDIDQTGLEFVWSVGSNTWHIIKYSCAI